MKSLEAIITDNEATTSNDKYMKKFVLEYSDWVQAKDIIGRAQNGLNMESLQQNSRDKKFLITMIVEEV